MSNHRGWRVLGIGVLFLAASGLVAATLPAIMGVDLIQRDFDRKSSKTEGWTIPKGWVQEDGALTSQKGEAWIVSPIQSVGYAWRPPKGAKVHTFLKGDGEFELQIRYGCDRVHWSDWETLKRDEKVEKRPFAVELKAKTGAYDNLNDPWWETKPVWNCDEDAKVRWIAKENPKFFEENIPIVGYVQLRLRARQPEENSSPVSAVSLKRVECRVHWGVGGLHTTPSDGSKPDYDKKWCFKLR